MATAPRALVLAAGKGTRMGGDRPKVLTEAAGRPLLQWVLDALSEAGISRSTVIVGYGKESVISALPAGADWVEQAEQLGTGHAVASARQSFEGFGGVLLVTCGDMPLVRGDTYRRLLDAHAASRAAGTILTARQKPPHRYGRILRAPGGQVLRIVEAADATPEELAVDEINTGVYAFSAPALFAVLDRIRSDNRQGEYYLTDAIALLIGDGLRVTALACEDPGEALGVNSPDDLDRVEAQLARAGQGRG